MNKERAARYLGMGVKPGEVASIMGCSPGYISQLLKEEPFGLMVIKFKEELDGTIEKEEESIHMKYVGLEHKLVEAIGSSIVNADLRDQVAALKVVAERQEKVALRKMPMRDPGTGNSNHITIQLTLPQHAIPAQPTIVLNSKAEVVEIDGKAMSPMSSKGVEDMFKKAKAQKELVEIQNLEKEL